MKAFVSKTSDSIKDIAKIWRNNLSFEKNILIQNIGTVIAILNNIKNNGGDKHGSNNSRDSRRVFKRNS